MFPFHARSIQSRPAPSYPILAVRSDVSIEQVSDYFRSGPCLNEIRRGVKHGIPIIFLLETDPTHGGVSLAVHKRDCPSDLRAILDSASIIEWHRVEVRQLIYPGRDHNRISPCQSAQSNP